MREIFTNTTTIAAETMAIATKSNSTWRSFFLKVFISFILVSNYKVIPFKWTLHFYYYVVKYLYIAPLLTKKTAKKIADSSSSATSTPNESESSFISSDSSTTTLVAPPSPPKPETRRHLFFANAYTSRVVALECDMNGHKSNSTYFNDLDLARSDLLLDVLSAGFIHYRKTAGFYPYCPLGSVACIFKREIKPYQKYVIRSRILGWDQKWLFVISRFEFYPPKGEPVPQGKKSQSQSFPLNEHRGKLAAIGLSKYVFKLGRKTIPPEEFLTSCEASLNITQEEYKQGRMNFEYAKGLLEAEANTVDMELY